VNTALIYDIEIKKAVPDKNFARQAGIEYCEGWHDHANMGISVIGAYDYLEDRYRTFCDDNLNQFISLCEVRAPLVSFNGIGFDDKVITAVAGGMPDSARYDILRELWVAAGLSPTFGGKSHGGFGLEATCEANYGMRKTGNGALAPALWQQGRIGEVIDYCLNDVRMTKRLFDDVLAGVPIISAKTGDPLSLRAVRI
jgi:hypothetical protein